MAFKKVPRKKMFRAKGRKGTTTKKYKRKAGPSLRAIAAKVSKLTKTIETKSGVELIADGIEYLHNNLYTVRNTRQNGENVNPFVAITPWLATRAGHGPDGSTPHQYR